MNSWFLDSAYREMSAEKLFGSLDSVFRLDGELIAKDPLSCVLRVSVDGKRYYVSKHHLTLVRRGYVHPQSADGEEQDQAEFEHSRIIGAQSNSCCTSMRRRTRRCRSLRTYSGVLEDKKRPLYRRPFSLLGGSGRC